MERSKVTDDTINAYNEVLKKHPNIGIVLQAYLHRSFKELSTLPNTLNFRLCKGIYKESKEIAIQDKREINFQPSDSVFGY